MKKAKDGLLSQLYIKAGGLMAFQNNPLWNSETAQTLRRVIADTWKTITERQLLQAASSLAYTTILSIIPLLAVSFAIFRAFGGMDKLFASLEPMILENLAEGTGQEALANIQRFIVNTHAGAVGFSGFVALVFTSMSMLSSAEKAINRVWNTEIQRKLFHRIAGYWLFITIGPLALAFAVGSITSSDLKIGQYLPKGTGGLLLTVLVFMSIYKWVPNRKVHWTPALIAGAYTSLLMLIAKSGYGLYTQTVVSYNKIYGSLGAVPIVLFWIYINWVIVLTGAALSAALQRRAEL